MGQVISLHAERWVEGVFEESGLRIDVSTKGNVRFSIGAGEPGAAANGVESRVLTMEQMARLGEALSVAYREEEDDGQGHSA